MPQRRRRVYLVATASDDFEPQDVLFADGCSDWDEAEMQDDAFGFYWTEGRTGLGWARDAVPTLKGGSSLGIPSPPAVWLPDADIAECLVTPSIEAAEVLQGFEPGHTATATSMERGKNSHRWKLVGNAVTVGVAEWLGSRLANPGKNELPHAAMRREGKWPSAAFGSHGDVFAVEAGEIPGRRSYQHLRTVIDEHGSAPLSHRAASGFWSRLSETNLGREAGFRDAVEAYVELG